MSSVCSAGHASTDDDYCSVCGTPIESGAPASSPAPLSPPDGLIAATPGGLEPPAPPSPAAPGATLCPNCSTENVADALFCEACGYDFTTGTLPRSGTVPASAAPDGDPFGSGGSDVSGSGGSDGSGSGGSDGSGSGGSGSGGSDSGGSDSAGSDSAGTGAAQVPYGSAAGESAQQPAAATEELPWAVGAGSTAAGGGSAPGPGGAPTPHVAEIWIDPAWYEMQQSPDSLPSPGLPTVVALHGTSLLVGRASRSRGISPDVDCEPDSGVSRRQAQLTTDGTRWFVEDLDSANGTFVGAAGAALPQDPIRVGSKHELQPGDRIYVGAWTRIVVRPATEDELP